MPRTPSSPMNECVSCRVNECEESRRLNHKREKWDKNRIGEESRGGNTREMTMASSNKMRKITESTG